jgi:hypothetical protein
VVASIASIAIGGVYDFMWVFPAEGFNAKAQSSQVFLRLANVFFIGVIHRRWIWVS